MKIEAKPMSWPQSRAFNKFRKELDAKSLPEDEKGEEAIEWVLDNIYPDLDNDEITQADAIWLFEQTVKLSQQRTIDEEKN